MSIPSEGWLKLPGLNMHYLDWEGVGAPVVALHGLASSSHWYDLVITHLMDGFRFIALDQRAHGKTDQPGMGYDWRTLATDVTEAMGQLGIEQATIVGHSWGASVALSVAALYPHRVTKLVLIEGGISNLRLNEMTWEQFKARLSPRDIYGSKERYLGILRQQFADCWSDQLESMVMSMVRIDPEGMVHERLEPGNHEQVLWTMWTEPASTMFPYIRCPVLLVAAERPWSGVDSSFVQRRRAGVAAAQSAIGNSRVVWMSDCGHDIGYQVPQELAEVLREFLSEE